jgi:hypothetical protein
VRALRYGTGDDPASDFMPDCGMDLNATEYAGTPLAWLSHTGVVAPSVYGPEGWLHSFGGGLLVTCGLHGRVSSTPRLSSTSPYGSSRRSYPSSCSGP